MTKIIKKINKINKKLLLTMVIVVSTIMFSQKAGYACTNSQSTDYNAASTQINNDNSDAATGDDINMVSGSYTTHINDFNLTSGGINVRFDRNYNSRLQFIGGFGVGWTHSFDIQVITAGIGLA